ncbi:MAG: PepSY-like domain-containing protein [Chitinophagales bacterium]|nr:PepSY-like domain-containing protein [Chitinophagales bacterium]
MLGFMGFFSACSEDIMGDIQAEGVTVSSSSDDSVEQIPDAIAAYLAANYADVVVLYVEDENDEDNPAIAFEAHLADGTEIYFDADGGFLFAESADDDDDINIDPATLPTAILDYLAANYPDMTIEEANMEDGGGYEVEFGGGFNLYFDANGNFLGLDSDEDNDGDGEEDEDDDNDGDSNDNVDISTLPAAINDYVAANYPGTSIVEADSEDNGGFEIELSNGIEMYFDANGNFLGFSDGDSGGGGDDDNVDISTLPAAINDYVAANYPGTSIVEANSEDNGGFEIELSNGIEMYFDANGNFLGFSDGDSGGGGDDDNDGDDDNSGSDGDGDGNGG